MATGNFSVATIPRPGYSIQIVSIGHFFAINQTNIISFLKNLHYHCVLDFT